MVKGSMECARVDGSWLMYGKTASVEEGTDLGMVMMTVWCRAMCSMFPRYSVERQGRHL